MKATILPLFLTAALATAGTDIDLPKPRTTGGKPLMEVLATRKSTRTFDADKDLPLDVLSSLLWAANGVARDADHRTAPSAVNAREIELYVVGREATYRYDPEANRLVFHKEGDFRADTGLQPFAAKAPVNLLLVCDMGKLARMDAAAQAKYSCTDTGFVSENIYLFCASEGLATVVRAMVPKESLAAALGLAPTQEITLVQTVGWSECQKK